MSRITSESEISDGIPSPLNPVPPSLSPPITLISSFEIYPLESISSLSLKL